MASVADWMPDVGSVLKWGVAPPTMSFAPRWVNADVSRVTVGALVVIVKLFRLLSLMLPTESLWLACARYLPAGSSGPSDFHDEAPLVLMDTICRASELPAS